MFAKQTAQLFLKFNICQQARVAFQRIQLGELGSE